MRLLLPVLLALGLAGPALSLPAPPPPPQELAFLQSFFRVLPRGLPPEDSSSLDRYVSPDVKVYRSGELAHGNRADWFSHLRSFAPRSPGEPNGVSISREAFYRMPDGAIMVLEFVHPRPPAGREAEVSYHVTDPFQLVTYRFDGEQLVRVDYGQPMRSYDDWLRNTGTGQSEGRR